MGIKDENYADRILNTVLSSKGWLDTLSLQAQFEHRLEELNISKHQALKIMDLETKVFDGFMVGGSTKVDYLTVLKLAKFFEIPPSVFIDKFIAKVTEENKEDLERTAVRLFIAKHFDLEGLKKIGFIDSVNDFDAIEKKVLHFFGYDSIFQYKRHTDVPVYSSGKRASKEESLQFWVNMAYASFERIHNPNEFDREALVSLFPTFRAYSLNMEQGLAQVAKLLFKVGVTTIFVPKLYGNLHIRAATLCIDDKPCIALTNYLNYYPTLWFALIHELYHVLYDWDEICKSETQSHLSAGVSMGGINEESANEFARRYLFSEEKMKGVEDRIDDRQYVSRVARENNVHPSIVYAIYAFTRSTSDNRMFARYNGDLPAPTAAIRPFDPKSYETFKPISQITKKTLSQIK